MIDYTLLRRDMELYISTNFTTVPIQFENTILTNVDDYIALIDVQAVASNPAMGSKSTLITGILVIQIFSVYGTGTENTRSIADELSDDFLGVTVGDIKFKAPTLTSVGKVDGANYYLHNLSFEYEYVAN